MKFAHGDRLIVMIVALALALLAGTAGAATNWWNGPAAGWDAVASWSTVSSATTPNPGSVPGASDTAIFSIDGFNTGGAYISLNANQSIHEMIFRNTGGQTIRANATALQPDRTLTIGAGGVTTLPGSGAVNLFPRDPLTYAIGADQVWRVAGGALNIALTGNTGGSGRTIITDQGVSNSLTLVYGTLNVGINESTAGYVTNNAITSLSSLNLGAGGTLQITSRGANFYEDRIGDSIPINSYGGTFYNFINVPVATVLYTETVGAVTLVKGALNQTLIQVGSGVTNVLTYSALSQSGTATAMFSGGGLGNTGDLRDRLIITGQSTATIMGGWATVNATGFASYDTTAYLGYARGVYGNAGAAIATNTSDAAGIYNFNTAISAAANLTVGALLCTPTAGRTLTLGANNLTIATGGLFFDDDANVHTISATSGKVMAGSGSDTNLYVTVATAANQTGAKIISAEIADNGSGKLTLVKAGLGTLTASAANTYSGNTIINEGTLQINKASAQSNFGTCNNTVNITVADTSVFAPGVLLSSSVSSPALGTRYVIAISSPTVLVANGTITNSHSGALSAPAISGTIASSPTIEVLYGATLDVTYHRTATWTVESAQTLKGNGTVVAKDPGGANRTIQIDGKVAPGSSAGTLTVTGNVVFANNSVLEIEAKNALLGGDKWEAGYDRLTVAGTVDLGSNAKLDVSLLAGETLALGDKLFIVDNDSTDAVSGLFKKPTGTVLNEGDAFAVGVQGFKVYYAADLATGAFTGGNDVALEVVNPFAASGGGTILMVQ